MHIVEIKELPTVVLHFVFRSAIAKGANTRPNRHFLSFFFFEVSSCFVSNGIMVDRAQNISCLCKIYFAFALVVPVVFVQTLLGQAELKDENKNKTTQKSTSQKKSLAKDLPGRKLLKEHGIEPTVQGIEKYFDSLLPRQEPVEVATRIAERLSDSEYSIREKATAKLRALSGVSIATLKTLRSTMKSPEARYRLKSIIDERSLQNRSQLQYAALNLIAQEELAGLIPSIIKSESFLEPDSFIQLAISKAIGISSTPDDVELLKQVLKDGSSSPASRVGSLTGLTRVAPETALDLARDLVDQTGLLGLEVARTLVESKDLASFDKLAGLLEDKNFNVRVTALNKIRSLTGLSFENNYLANEASVSVVRKQVKTWLSENEGKEINYHWSALNKLGRRLVTDYSKGVITEFDQSGKVTWKLNVNHPFACMGLPNGHRLIAHYVGNKLVEYDENGKEIRSFEFPGTASGFCLQDDGVVWVAAGQNGNQIMQYSPEGKQLKSFVVDGTPTSIEIGNNGNLVCALYDKNQIVELDTDGKIQRTIKAKGKPYHAQPLANGNFLVALYAINTVAEIDPNGKIVWQHKCAQSCYRAQELEDGSISFADAKGVHRVNRSGIKIESLDLESGGKIYYSFSY